MYSKFKKLLVFSILLLLSGCTAQYNLDIDSNLILTEDITMTEENIIIDTFSIDPETYLDEMIQEYSSNDDYNYYNFKKNLDSYDSGVTAKATYLDFSEYRGKNKIKDLFFDDFIYSSISNIATLTLHAKEKIDMLTDTNINNAAINQLKVTITLPFLVVENNADEVNKEAKAYTWIYNKNTVNKDIILKFSTSKEAPIVVSKNVYIIAGFVLFIVSLIIYIYYRYKKNSVL